MQLKSRLTAAAVAGIVAAGSLAATLTSASPASADNHGGYGDRNGGHRDHRDDRRYERGYVRGYAYPAPVYATPVYDYPVYPQPVYPVYGYGYPSRGYVHVSTPGFSLGVRL
jgi:hypothetical protein